MMKTGFLWIWFVVLGFIIPADCFSQSMSELDMGGFEKRDKDAPSSTVKSPFMPARPSPKDMLVEDLYLTGIAIGGGRDYALISGQILTEGDSIAGLRVKTIARDRVILQHLDKVHTLHLEGGI